MPNYPVFASYAQLDRDKHLVKFIDELRSELRSLRAAEDEKTMALLRP